MARHERLPVYMAVLNLAVRLEEGVFGLSRKHEYKTLGTELRDGSRAVLQQVLRAKNAATHERRAALERPV